MKIGFPCPHCSAIGYKEAGAVNRAQAIGAPIYCSRECSGLARRKDKTLTQKKEEKRIYDATYRIRLSSHVKARKQAYHKRTYDPVDAARKRKARMPIHVEYCRQPEYRAYKKEYDKRYNMERTYGPFWEAARMLIDVEHEVKSRATNYEIDIQNDTLNKTLKRKRAYGQASNDTSRQQQQAFRDQSQVCAVGNAQRHQERQDAPRTGRRDRRSGA